MGGSSEDQWEGAAQPRSQALSSPGRGTGNERAWERGWGLRTVFDGWKQPYEDLLRRAKLTTLTNKRLRDIATFTYKAKHKTLPPPVQELFTNGHTRYSLRNSDLFRKEHFNTKKYGKHPLCYYGSSLWSKLDRKLRASTSLGSLKSGFGSGDERLWYLQSLQQLNSWKAHPSRLLC